MSIPVSVPLLVAMSRIPYPPRPLVVMAPPVKERVVPS
jgi:hypothetical protein